MSFETNITSLATRIGTEFKTVKTYISGNGTGNVSGLTTTTKNLVGAINEVKQSADAAVNATVPDATEAVKGKVQLASIAEAKTGTDTSKSVTPKGLHDTLQDVIGAAPAALDTLNELAAALGNDANFASTVTSQLSGKQASSAALNSISGLTTAANKAIYTTAVNTYATYDLSPVSRTFLAKTTVGDMLTNIGGVSSSAVGDTNRNFVTDFETALQ